MRPVAGSMRFWTAASGTSLTKTQIFTCASSGKRTFGILPDALTDESIGRRGRAGFALPAGSAALARGALGDGVADEVDDGLRRRPGREDLGDAEGLELGDVVGGDRAAHG